MRETLFGIPPATLGHPHAPELSSRRPPTEGGNSISPKSAVGGSFVQVHIILFLLFFRRQQQRRRRFIQPLTLRRGTPAASRSTNQPARGAQMKKEKCMREILCDSCAADKRPANARSWRPATTTISSDPPN